LFVVVFLIENKELENLKMSDFVFVAVPPQSSVEVLLGSAAHPTGSATIDPRSPGMEFSALLSRKSFLEDILKKSFSSSQRNRSATRPLGDSDDNDFVVVPSATTPKDASPQRVPPLQSSNTTTTTVTISPAQWERTLRQFGLDINRQCFVVEGRRYTDSDGAIKAVSDFLRHLLERGGTSNPYLRRFHNCGEGRDEHVYESHDGSLASTLTPRMCDTSLGGGGGGLTTPWLWFAFSSSNAQHNEGGLITCVNSNYHPSLASASHHSISNNSNAQIIEEIVHQLTREVLLVSQQSVMGFPLELLTHCVNKASGGSMDAPEWYVGEVRKGVQHPKQDNDESIMKIELSEGVAKPTPPPSLYEASCSGASGMLWSLLGYLAPKKQHPPSHPTSTPASKVPTLRISKLLRVFSIDMDSGKDVTQFHIQATLEISLFGGEDDPVQLTWSVVKERTNDDEEPAAQQQHAHEDEGRVDNDQGTPHDDDVASYPTGVQLCPPAPVGADDDRRAPPPAEADALNHHVEVRCCNCLGGPLGFHRRDCAHVVV
jgi:hypothetical protein